MITVKASLTTPELKGDLLSSHALTQNATEGPVVTTEFLIYAVGTMTK